MKKILVLLLGCTCTTGAFAQDTPAPAQNVSSSQSSTPTQSDAPTPNGKGTAVTADTSATEASAMDLGGTDQNRARMRLGWLDVHPHLDFTANYDDNIFIASTNEVADFQYTISPGVLLGAGDYVSKNETYMSLDYTPSIILFQDNTAQDAVEQNVDFQGQYRFNKLSLGVRQGYQHLTGALVQVGNRVDRNIYPTQIRADYDVTAKISLDADFSQVISDYKTQFDNTTWKISGYANYKPTAKLKFGIGPTVGWRDIQANPNQTFEEINGRVLYEVTQKISLHAKAGASFRQTQGGYSRTSPVFSLGGTWTPYEATTVSLDAYRDEYSSTTLTSQNYYATGFSMRIRQKFMEKIYFGIGGGYENSEYYATSAKAAPTNREDNYFYVRPSIDYQITDFWSAGIFYMYRDNSSTATTNEFFNNQAGIQSSVVF